MTASKPSAYVPPPHAETWGAARPCDVGLDAAKLTEAADFALASDSPWPRSFHYSDGRYVGIVEWNEKGPWSDVSGPVRPRGGPAGLVLKGGQIVAEWGDTNRCDMTFSVAKSYLAVLTGLAVADGLIPSIDSRVGETVPGPWFESAHNAPITWRHLLTQTSEWQGELWGKSDQVDHFRSLGGDNARKGDKRDLQTPGAYYEYNDVRVNLLAFCLLQRFGRPLPEVLRARIMDPIGASPEWEWHGYETSWVEIGGRRVQSVSGGAHWGGGMFIGARDHARLGLLIARRGRWGDRQVLPADWVDQMLSPSPTNASYGLLWWLNCGTARHRSAPATSVFALGAGNNMIWIDPDHDLVTVLRWIDKTAVDGFLKRLLAAATPASGT